MYGRAFLWVYSSSLEQAELNKEVDPWHTVSSPIILKDFHILPDPDHKINNYSHSITQHTPKNTKCLISTITIVSTRNTSCSFSLWPMMVRDSPNKTKWAPTSTGFVPVTLYKGISSSVFFGEYLIRTKIYYTPSVGTYTDILLMYRRCKY